MAVVVTWLDRFGRSVLERARSAEQLRKLDVRIYSVMEGGELVPLVANLLAAVAEDEVRRLGERIKEARAFILANGWRVPGKAPWGYMWRSATLDERTQGAPVCVLVANPVQTPYVRELFARADAGETLQALMRWFRSLPEDARGGLVLSSATLRARLMSPVYIARLEHGVVDVLARPLMRWEAAIDDQTWQRVCERFAAQSRAWTKKIPSLLTGLLRCGICDGYWRAGGTTRWGRQYRCARKRTEDAATGHRCCATVLEHKIDTQVLGQVEPLLAVVRSIPRGDEKERRRAFIAQWRLMVQREEREREAGEGEATSTRRVWAEAALELVDGAVDEETYRRRREGALQNLARSTGKNLERGSEPEIAAQVLWSQMIGIARAWDRAKKEDDVLGQQALLQAMIARVVPVRQRWGKYFVTIEWTGLGETLRLLGDRDKARSLSPEPSPSPSRVVPPG